MDSVLPGNRAEVRRSLFTEMDGSRCPGGRHGRMTNWESRQYSFEPEQSWQGGIGDAHMLLSFFRVPLAFLFVDTIPGLPRRRGVTRPRRRYGDSSRNHILPRNWRCVTNVVPGLRSVTSRGTCVGLQTHLHRRRFARANSSSVR